MQTPLPESIIRQQTLSNSPFVDGFHLRILTMTTAAELFALQEIDLALDKDLARLAEIEASLVETEELVAARELVAERRAILDELKAKQRDLEWSVEEVRTKAGEIEGRLYGGTIKNPKELQDLDADLRSLKTQTRTREDSLLALLVEVDEAEAALREAETACAEVEAAWRTAQEEMLAEKARLEPEVAALQARRNAEAEGKDTAALSLYNLLRERRGGVAVAAVERGACQGCRISLPTNVLAKVRSGAGLVQCVSCERILMAV